ncbi:MAG: glycosyltransferase family 39 protein [Xenococcaceae cyanobacterium]
MPKPPRRFSLEFLLLSAIAIAILLRIINLGSREFWYDEVLSLLLSTGQKGAYKTPQELPVVLADYTLLLNLPVESGISDILKTGEKLLKGLVAEPHPPLFFLGQHLWLRLFGNSEAAMRSLGALFSVGAIGSAWGLGRRLLGHRGGLLLAALLGLNPYYLFHSLNVRMYAPLVFWTIFSTWALLELIGIQNSEKKFLNSQPLWSLILIGSVTAGLMTFYYFACWLVALAALVFLLDRQRWWQHGLRLGTGILLTIPWVLWGTRQQLRNADLGRFAASANWVETAWRHLEGAMQTLGIHLLLGDWVTSLPPAMATVAGVGAIALLVACSISLWRQNQRRVLGVALLLGIFPLLLMLVVDVVTGKFTVGFGWGRSMIFILPGCLLLLAAWSERTAGQWQRPAAIILLLFYLSISVADFSTRERWMFHQIADIIEQEPTTPTLIAMNSQAWGHVLRLAYYRPPTSPVMLLAQNSAKLAPALQKTLGSESVQYQRILWLDSDQPVWGHPSTELERKQVHQVLESQFELDKTQQLSGTSKLDNFTASLYQRRSY